MTFAELVLLLVLIAGVFAIAGWVARLVGWARGRGDLQPGQVWRLDDNPFDGKAVEILAVRDGWVQYTPLPFKAIALTMEASRFRRIYSRRPKPETDPTPKGAVQGQGSAEP